MDKTTREVGKLTIRKLFRVSFDYKGTTQALVAAISAEHAIQMAQSACGTLTDPVYVRLLQENIWIDVPGDVPDEAEAKP